MCFDIAGIAVLVAAAFFDYMLALLQQRVRAMFSSKDVSYPRICVFNHQLHLKELIKKKVVPSAQQSQPYYNGWDGDYRQVQQQQQHIQQQPQQQQQHHHKHFSSSTKLTMRRAAKQMK